VSRETNLRKDPSSNNLRRRNSFPRGATECETTKTITIEVKGDSKKEAHETFYLDLFGNSSNSLFTKNRGLGTILNDD
jgi:hypothetical protein